MTHSKRTRRVTGRRPTPATVQSEALVPDDLEHATATERLWVCLALDLEHVEGEQDDLSDTDQTACCRGE